MTDPFFGPLVEALNNIAVNSYTARHKDDGETYLQKTGWAIMAGSILSYHDPAPVLRVLRAAVELEKERKNIVSGAASPSTTNFVQAESNHIIAVNALLEVPAYREWLEGVE